MSAAELVKVYRFERHDDGKGIFMTDAGVYNYGNKHDVDYSDDHEYPCPQSEYRWVVKNGKRSVVLAENKTRTRKKYDGMNDYIKSKKSITKHPLYEDFLEGKSNVGYWFNSLNCGCLGVEGLFHWFPQNMIMEMYDDYAEPNAQGGAYYVIREYTVPTKFIAYADRQVMFKMSAAVSVRTLDIVDVMELEV